MSDVFRVSMVAEGPTDFIVLDALVERFLGSRDYVSNQIQPPTSEYANQQGPLGGGWRGVLKWCAEMATDAVGFATSVVMSNCDCLIIHVDADIAAEPDELKPDLSAPCPPAASTCDNVRDYIANLLGGAIPDRVVLCVPSQCIEAWVFAALHPSLVPAFEPLECRPAVERLLIQKRDRLVRNKDGSAKKDVRNYHTAANKIADGWPNAVAICSEAARFEHDCTPSLH